MIDFRPLAMSDAQALFVWRNDPDTCRFSRDTKPAVWDGHVKWLARRVNGHPTEKHFVATNDDGISIGLVWITDQDDDQKRELHYRMDPNYREKGLGTAMVMIFADRHLKNRPFSCPIIEGNERSEKIARHLGLAPHARHPIGDGDERVIVEWKK